jgi:predicted dienelactone hydrolase
VPSSNDAYPEEFSGVEQELATLDKKKMAQNWKDKRIKAAFLMAPSWGWIFDKKSLQKITIPTYIVASNSARSRQTKKLILLIKTNFI